MEKANEKFTLKLLIDKNSNRVLFGEASKNFVDFIFSLLSLPLGAVAKLLTKDAMVGSIGEVYQSLSKLSETYVHSTENISFLLNRHLASTSNTNTNFLLPPASRKFYVCHNTRSHNSYGSSWAYVSEVKGATCPYCKTSMNMEAVHVTPNSLTGVVREGVTYTVMDDLTVVVPMSTISSLNFLNKFQIKDLGSLEEKMVRVGFEEGLQLLKASLQTKAVLTDVFLKKNGAPSA